MTLINLTPHPLRIYTPTTPDVVDLDEHEPFVVLPPMKAYPVARTREHALRAGDVWGIPMFDLRAEPGTLPVPMEDTLYVVSRPVAMSALDRDDLLVIHREVRDYEGRTVGCRALGRLLSVGVPAR